MQGILKTGSPDVHTGDSFPMALVGGPGRGVSLLFSMLAPKVQNRENPPACCRWVLSKRIAGGYDCSAMVRCARLMAFTFFILFLTEGLVK